MRQCIWSGKPWVSNPGILSCINCYIDRVYNTSSLFIWWIHLWFFLVVMMRMRSSLLWRRAKNRELLGWWRERRGDYIERSACVVLCNQQMAPNLATFLTNIAFSVCETFVLGNEGWFRAASSHSLAFICLLISLFRGSLSLSSSLREAFPPIFLARHWQRRGPSVFMAPDRAC